METKRFDLTSIYRQLRRRVQLVFVLMATVAFGIASSLASHAVAQDEPATGTEPVTEAAQETAGETESAPAADETLESLLEQWKVLEAEMIAIEGEMLATDVAETTTVLRKSYTEKNDAAGFLVGKIEAAALASLAAGEKGKELFELLTGIVINHADFERDQSALEIGQKLIDAGVEKTYFDMAGTADRLSPSAKEVVRELAIRSAEATANDLPRVKLVTSKGEIVLELFENEAPDTVGNFVSLIESGFYNGLTFHRVLDNFMAQGGDPKGDGTGGPGYTIFCECYKSDARRHFPGSLSMAKSEARDTGGSQFFLTFVRPTTPPLDGRHTVFGRVIEGMDVVNSLQKIDPEAATNPEPDKIITAEVLRKRQHEYQPKKVGGG